MTSPSPVSDPGAASARLTDNRERMARWLEKDRLERSQPSLGRWAAGAAGAAWPLIQGLRAHPAAPLALGVLVQARRHPRTALALISLVGAAWLLGRARLPSRQP
jgi:hypothetical protein